MSYSNEEVLTALYETLNIAKEYLKTLLTVDHPPPDYCARIYKEMSAIKDLTDLVHEYESKIAVKKFY
jgi:hypothetical protein